MGRADDNRGDRRAAVETEKGRDSDVADNEPRRPRDAATKEAMHRKEGPNLKLTNNKRIGPYKILPIFYCNEGGRGENILRNIVGNK